MLLRDAPPLNFDTDNDTDTASARGSASSTCTPNPTIDWEPILFSKKDDARCCNSMAWDPHVYRLSLTGPWLNGKRLRCNLEDVYAKSDLFAVGRMAYDALLSDVEGKAFPTVKADKLTYGDDEVGAPMLSVSA